MKSFYLYTEPYTFFFYKKNTILLYNYLDKQSTIVKVGKKLKHIAEKLKTEKCIMLTEEEIQEKDIDNFIQLLKDSFNGDILPTGKTQILPALFTPIINNQREFNRLLSVEKINIDNQIMNYLEEIYIYLNGVNEQTDYPIFLQVPSYINREENIDANKLIQWMGSIQDKQISLLSLLGGKVLCHPQFKQILDAVKPKAHKIRLYYRYDLLVKKDLYSIQELGIDQLFIIVPMPTIKESLAIQKIKESKIIHSQWLFLVSSEKEYTQAERLIKKYNITDYQFKPLFIGSNLAFFQDEVFLSKEDILSLNPEKRDIYANQKINRNEFGRITILPNGSIYANPNKPRLGTIEKSKIHDIIYDEMNKGHSWLHIRKQKPCSNCVFQWICPPPSNYEIIIKKTNLCHFHDNINSKNKKHL